MTTLNSTIRLYKNKSQVIINPLGFKIDLLQLDNQVVLDKFVRGDSKSTSSHPCLPIFGPETNTNYGLAQHGNTRNSLAEVVEQTSTTLVLRHQINEGTYPPGLVFQQSFNLKDNEFGLKSTFINEGKRPLPLNFAEHFYWNTPRGWQDLKINNEDAAVLVKNDKGFLWQNKNIISISGQNDILLEQENLPYCQLWTFSKNGKYDQSYVCIEPARGKPRSTYFDSTESILKPNEIIKTEIKISLK